MCSLGTRSEDLSTPSLCPSSLTDVLAGQVDHRVGTIETSIPPWLRAWPADPDAQVTSSLELGNQGTTDHPVRSGDCYPHGIPNYMCCGASIPSKPSPSSNTRAVRSHNLSRLMRTSSSGTSTLQFS